MKTGTKVTLWVVGLCLISMTAFSQPVDVRTKGIFISNGDNSAFFKAVNTSSNQTANMLELWNNPVSPNFLISPTGVILTGGLQNGTNKMVATSVTNTFGTAYPVPPTVVVCGSDANIVCGVTNITTTNFIINVSATGGVVNWIAVGK